MVEEIQKLVERKPRKKQKTHQLPKELDSSLWQKLMPPDFKIYFDKVNMRTQAYSAASGSLSRSWSLYGATAATLTVLDLAYSKAIERAIVTENPYAEVIAAGLSQQ